MMKKEYWKILKRLADRMSGDTIAEFYKMDRSCSNHWDKLQEAERKFSELELTQEERRAVDELLAVREEIDTNNTVLAYMAGIMDCLSFLTESEQMEI